MTLEFIDPAVRGVVYATEVPDDQQARWIKAGGAYWATDADMLVDEDGTITVRETART